MKRNPDANCGSCPYWIDTNSHWGFDKERKIPLGYCVKSHPTNQTVESHPTDRANPRILTPRITSDADYLFPLMEGFRVCGEHPDFIVKEYFERRLDGPPLHEEPTP